MNEAAGGLSGSLRRETSKLARWEEYDQELDSLVRRRASAAAIILATANGALADGLGSDFDASKAGDQTLTLWWLGNQEVPGIETWLTGIRLPVPEAASQRHR